MIDIIYTHFIGIQMDKVKGIDYVNLELWCTFFFLEKSVLLSLENI